MPRPEPARPRQPRHQAPSSDADRLLARGADGGELPNFAPRWTAMQSAMEIKRENRRPPGRASLPARLPQPFVCLADGARPMSHEFRVSVSEHRQHFGNCLGLAFTARRMDHCFARLPQYLRASTNGRHRATDAELVISSNFDEILPSI